VLSNLPEAYNFQDGKSCEFDLGVKTDLAILTKYGEISRSRLSRVSANSVGLSNYCKSTLDIKYLMVRQNLINNHQGLFVS
jgi:hypothetical protein